MFNEIPGCAEGIEHKIISPEGKAVREKWRRIPYQYDVIKTEINEMLALGIITKSRSPWRSPLVAVPKQDGLLRLCVDFRKLNAISKI